MKIGPATRFLIFFYGMLGGGALADTAGIVTPGSTAYPASGMRRINKITLSNPLYRGDYLGLIDETNGYAYFTSAGSANPGWITKINIQGTVPYEVGSDHGAANEAIFNAGVIDPSLGYAYVGTTMGPPKIVRFALGTGDVAPAYAGSIALTVDGGQAIGAVIDTTDPLHHYGYFCCGGSPGRIVKIALDSFTEVSALTLSGTGEFALRRGAFDPVNRCAYFATIHTASNPRVVKVRCTDGSAAPQYVGSIELDTVPLRIGSAVIDSGRGYGFFGVYDPGVTPAKVYKVRLNGTALPTLVSTLPLAAGERELSTALIDPTAGYAFFGQDHVYPGKIYKVRLMEGDTMPVETSLLPLQGGTQTPPSDGSNSINNPPTLYGEVFLQSSVRDTARGYAYFGTDSTPGQVVKVALGHQGAIKATRVSLPVTAYVGEMKFYCHAATGHVRLAIYDNAAQRSLVWQSAPLNAAAGWISAPAPVTLAPGTYWLAWQLDNGADVPSYTAGTAGDGFQIESAYGAFPATISGATSTAETWSTHLRYYTTPIDAWRFAHFAAQEASATAADDGDPDRDGFSNLGEYALGGDPLVLGTQIAPQISSTGNRATLTFNRDATHADVQLTVRGSDDMQTWTDLARSSNGGPTAALVGGVSVTETGSGVIHAVEVRDLYGLDDPVHPRRFLRLRINR